MEWNNILNVNDISIETGDPVASAKHYQSGSSQLNSKTMGAKNSL